jgi:hypothetical protein
MSAFRAPVTPLPALQQVAAGITRFDGMTVHQALQAAGFRGANDADIADIPTCQTAALFAPFVQPRPANPNATANNAIFAGPVGGIDAAMNHAHVRRFAS